MVRIHRAWRRGPVVSEGSDLFGPKKLLHDKGINRTQNILCAGPSTPAPVTRHLLAACGQKTAQEVIVARNRVPALHADFASEYLKKVLLSPTHHLLLHGNASHKITDDTQKHVPQF